MKENTVYEGDNVVVMETFPDNCIDLTVTSPPYDEMRDYNGYKFDFKATARELFRVTKDGGRVVWIVGDQCKDFNESGTSFMQALYFKELGFKLNDTMIWNKGAEPTHNPSAMRYKQYFEYMFIFSKGNPKTYNEIKDVKNSLAGKTKTSQFKRLPNGKKVESAHSGKVVKYLKYQARSNVWKVKQSRKNNGHPAVFPESIAKDHIISWSNEGDVVLDPFAGSGTTLKVAKLNNRKYIGIEISGEYCEIINERLDGFLPFVGD